MRKLPFVDRFRPTRPGAAGDTLFRRFPAPVPGLADRVVAPLSHACGVTDAGRVRSHNEDAFHVAEDGTLLVVADGLGGHRAGEVAATLAIESVVAAVGEAPGEIAEGLATAFHAAHVRVQRAANEHPEWRGMGTTLIAARIADGVLHTCHVGDVRGYVRWDPLESTCRHASLSIL